MDGSKEKTFEQADLEIVQKLKSCRIYGSTDILPEDPSTGDIYLYKPINSHLISINGKWYLLPEAEKPEENLYSIAVAKDEKRNSVIQGLFDVLDWVMLPHKFYDPLDKAIDMLEADRETIYALEKENRKIKAEIKKLIEANAQE